MQEKQLASLKALLDIECKVAAEKDEDGVITCEGPWCKARKAIGLAFGLIEEKPPEEEKVDLVKEMTNKLPKSCRECEDEEDENELNDGLDDSETA